MRGRGNWLARAGVEEASRSPTQETLPPPQGEGSPYSSPLLLPARLLGAPAARTWQGGGKSVVALGTGTGTCSQQLSGHNTSTN